VIDRLFWGERERQALCVCEREREREKERERDVVSLWVKVERVDFVGSVEALWRERRKDESAGKWR